MRSAKTLIRLPGCAGRSETSLVAQKSYCIWSCAGSYLYGISKKTCFTLRKYAYPNTLKISPPKTGSFQTKNSDIFHISAQKHRLWVLVRTASVISAQNIDCGYSLEPPHRGGSNEYPQSIFLSRNMKNNVYPCKPQFYYIKVGFKGVKII